MLLGALRSDDDDENLPMALLRTAVHRGNATRLSCPFFPTAATPKK